MNHTTADPTPRTCVTCGEPLPAYSGRGRPRVAHAGACARLRKNAVEEERKESTYRAAVARAALELPDAEAVAADMDDEASTPDRLRVAGFGTLHDDVADEARGIPVWERARSQHRTEVLASLTREPEPRSAPVDIPLPQCWDCPLLEHVEGVRAVLTPSSLRALAVAGRRARDDRRLRAELGAAEVLMRRPA
jgi:hypothetical protein